MKTPETSTTPKDKHKVPIRTLECDSAVGADPRCGTDGPEAQGEAGEQRPPDKERLGYAGPQGQEAGSQLQGRGVGGHQCIWCPSEVLRKL